MVLEGSDERVLRKVWPMPEPAPEMTMVGMFDNCRWELRISKRKRLFRYRD